MKKFKGLDTNEALARLKHSLRAMDDERFFETLGISLEQLKTIAHVSLNWEYISGPWISPPGSSCDFSPDELLNCA